MDDDEFFSEWPDTGSDALEVKTQKAADEAAESWVPAYREAVAAGARGKATDEQVEILLNPPKSFADAVSAASGNSGKAKK